MMTELKVAELLDKTRKELKEFYANNPEIDDNPILETKVNTLELILEEEFFE